MDPVGIQQWKTMGFVGSIDNHGVCGVNRKPWGLWGHSVVDNVGGRGVALWPPWPLWILYGPLGPLGPF